MTTPGAISRMVIRSLAQQEDETEGDKEFGRNRWRRLAQRKLGEVRAASERLRSMTVLLEKLLECKCPNIEFCGRAIERSAQRPRRTRRGAKRHTTAKVSNPET